MSPIKAQPGKREEQVYKSDKGASKDKNWKPPKMTKKAMQNSPSAIKPEVKKYKDPNTKTSTLLDPAIKIAKMASTEVESKT